MAQDYYNSIFGSADNYNFAATGSTSWYEDVADWVTKGVPAATLSGVASIANTFAFYGKKLGVLEDSEVINVKQTLNAIDSDLGAYYARHQDGADIGGFILGSLVPGFLGIKALRMAQGGDIPYGISKAAGLFQSRQKVIMEGMEASIRSGAVIKNLDAKKIEAAAYGFGANAIDALAIEAAVGVSMSQSPVLDDYSWSNAVWNVALGGAIGGTLQAGKIWGEVKKYARAWDKTTLPYREIDLPSPQLATGSQIAILENALEAKKANIPAQEETELFNIAQGSISKLESELKLKYTNFSGGDADLGQTLFRVTRNWGVDDRTQIFSGLTEVTRPSTSALAYADRTVYYKNIFSPEQKYLTNVDGQLVEKTIPGKLYKNVLGEVPKQDKEPGFIIKPFAKVSQEMDDTADVILQKDKIVVLNPRAIEPYNAGKIPVFLDLTTGQLGTRIARSVGDLGKPALSADSRTLRAGEQEFALQSDFKSIFSNLEDLDQLALDADAHWVAAMVGKLPKDLSMVNPENLPQLQRLLSEGITSLPHIPDVLATLKEGKVTISSKLEVEGIGADYISRFLNVDREWVSTKTGNFMTYSAQNPENFLGPRHATLNYNSDSLLNGMQVRELAGVQATETAILKQNQIIAANYFGPLYEVLPKRLENQELPVGAPSFLAQAGGADYGNIQSIAEGIGRITQTKLDDELKNIQAATRATAHEIANNQELLTKLNIVVNDLRKLHFIPDYSYDSASGKLRLINPETNDIMDVFEGPIAKYLSGYFGKLDDINSHSIALTNASGRTTNLKTGKAFVPSINPINSPYVAFVRYRDGHVSGSSDMGAISAPTQEEFDRLISGVRQTFGADVEIIFKDQIKADKKIAGIYDSQLALQNTVIDSEIRRKGMLGQFLPRTDAQILDDLETFLVQKSRNLTRNFVEFNYAKDFQNLKFLGAESLQRAKSRFGSDKAVDKSVKDPYEDAIKTALNVSRMDEYSGWAAINRTAESMFTKAFDAVESAFSRAEKGEISYQQASKEVEQLGIKPSYGEALTTGFANTKIPQNELQGLVHKWNGTLAKYALRLDGLYGLVNALSLPILFGPEFSALKRNLADPSKVGALTSLASVDIPGTQGQGKLPSVLKLAHQAIADWFKKPELIKEYQSYGILKDISQEMRDGVESLTHIKPGSTLRELGQALANGTEKLAKLTQADKIEQFTRFIAARSMHQLTDAAGIPKDQAFAYINTAVNRVIGAYTVNQRPILFQGPVGAAIGLFQTYQFNLMQNLLRYVGDGDKKSAAIMVGMQNFMFGLQGNPGFYALNQYIGNSNTSQGDLVSSTYRLAGKEWGDWLMYGLPSNILQTNIYSRGDLTPREVTVVPTNIQDIPVVSATARLAASVWDTGKKMSAAGMDGDIMLQGLAMNGINRPLAGIAQLAMGSSVDRSGNLISATVDSDSISAFSRVAGGKPLDEAIALDAFYRQKAYEARDRQDIMILGSGIRNKLLSGEIPSDREINGLAEEYAARGGRIEYFNDWMMDNFTKLNKPIMEEMRLKMENQGIRNMFYIMGGEDL